MVAWPDADIPVVQLSVQTRLGPEHHYRLGQLLAPLRSEGVLIVGSGSFTHDLASFRSSGGRIDAPEPDWVHGFAEWMSAALKEGRTGDLLELPLPARRKRLTTIRPKSISCPFTSRWALAGQGGATSFQHDLRHSPHGCLLVRRVGLRAFASVRYQIRVRCTAYLLLRSGLRYLMENGPSRDWKIQVGKQVGNMTTLAANPSRTLFRHAAAIIAVAATAFLAACESVGNGGRCACRPKSASTSCASTPPQKARWRNSTPASAITPSPLPQSRHDADRLLPCADGARPARRQPPLLPDGLQGPRGARRSLDAPSRPIRNGPKRLRGQPGATDR